MSPSFGWAVVGPGAIAHKFADALRGVPGAWLAAVQGRDLGRAQAFAKQWADAGPPGARPQGMPAPLATTDLVALLQTPQVSAVYIATPHAFHAPVIRQCLDAGKAVLCEKSMVTDAAAARDVCALSQQRGVFLMEAMWTRFLPIYAQVGDWLRNGAIGELRATQSSFCFHRPYDPKHRLYDPAQAGGALLDIGIYSLSMLHWALSKTPGGCPPMQQLQANGVMWPSGTDRRTAATLDFGAGLTAQIMLAMDALSPNTFQLFGESGNIEIGPRFHDTYRATLHQRGSAPQVVEAPYAINGFEYEIIEGQRCVWAGLTESPGMPHQGSVTVMTWMDAIRERIGLRYPFDPA